MKPGDLPPEPRLLIALELSDAAAAFHRAAFHRAAFHRAASMKR